MKSWHWASLLLALALSGCATVPGTTTDRVDGRKVEYVQAGQGAPVVVFENGLGATLDWWAKVWPDTVAETRSLAYHRAGYGHSDAPLSPRDGAQVVDELRALLRARNLPPPYVLVGHSLGGLYMQLFARKYPGEVAALVLVDSTHPDQVKGAGNPENWPTWLKVVFRATTSDTAKQELAALDATGNQVSNLPVDPSVPVWVLSALRATGAPSAVADDANRKRADIAHLYPGSTQVWVDSGHGVPLEKPEAVVSAIRDAVRAARASRDVHKAQ
ncbi:alpha/beta hydrolase [Acidovorax sp. D2M1]|uniref:Alpha/beta hydrolase n=1 Tax=Acidovorax benzenivorans TaxID=2987520 RepID=A0ABT5S3I6_9BURK|nr:alpha/beta hydrolase [Acidovorax benzenivorans]MDD2180511.1 alpha/beta hydrolase [Acidovorax benzenivorans]